MMDSILGYSRRPARKTNALGTTKRAQQPMALRMKTMGAAPPPNMEGFDLPEAFLIAVPLSWDALWTGLKRCGWYQVTGMGHTIYYMRPCTATPTRGCRIGTDYFHSKDGVREHVCKMVLEELQHRQLQEAASMAAPKASSIEDSSTLVDSCRMDVSDDQQDTLEEGVLVADDVVKGPEQAVNPTGVDLNNSTAASYDIPPSFRQHMPVDWSIAWEALQAAGWFCWKPAGAARGDHGKFYRPHCKDKPMAELMDGVDNFGTSAAVRRYILKQKLRARCG